MFGFGKRRPVAESLGDLGGFSDRQPEAPKPMEAKVERKMETRPAKREKPDYSALAAQRKEAFSTNLASKWEKIKGFFGKAADATITMPDRVAYRAGQAKDMTVEKGKAAIHATAEAGKKGVEEAWEGINRGADYAVNKFNEKRNEVSVRIRDARKQVANSLEMRKYNKEQEQIKKYLEQIAELQRKIGMSQDVQNEITRKLQERFAARGVDFEALGFEKQGEAAAA